MYRFALPDIFFGPVAAITVHSGDLANKVVLFAERRLVGQPNSFNVVALDVSVLDCLVSILERPRRTIYDLWFEG